ncbi:Uncharacterised protein [Mycobacteroides abscessus]|nr:Uncharacterised protein [Mycobacteroides abscessus]
MRSASTTPASSVASVMTETGQIGPFSRSVDRYRRGAEYGHVGSSGQSRQRSAAPAGRSSGRKCFREPKLATVAIRLPVT